MDLSEIPPRSKDESYYVLSIFCTPLWNEKDLNILTIRSDHGGGFENESFKTFCENMKFSKILLVLELIHNKMGL